MLHQATASLSARPRWIVVVCAVFGSTLGAFGCGTQANEPATVPQPPPAPLEPTITGHFVDEDAGRSATSVDAGVHAETPPPADGPVLTAPDASAR
jgi:hypothetical protein